MAKLNRTVIIRNVNQSLAEKGTWGMEKQNIKEPTAVFVVTDYLNRIISIHATADGVLKKYMSLSKEHPLERFAIETRVLHD